MRTLLLAALFPLALEPPFGRSTIDDASIVGIFDAANSWDIVTGSLAAKKATRGDVKEFGAMLARDHETVRQQGRDLAQRLGVTATPPAGDFALLKNHQEAMKKLERLTGEEFDRAFLAHEVAFHKAVIDAVKSTFLPAIQNAELKAFVLKVAPAFEAHMLAAKNLLEKKQGENCLTRKPGALSESGEF